MAPHNDFEQANQRSEELQSRIPHAVTARYDRKTRRIVIELSSKLVVSFSPADVEGLEHTRPSQLTEVRISPSGFGIHFPAIDTDLYVPGFWEGFLGSKAKITTRDSVRQAAARAAKPRRPVPAQTED
jgi:hypothetical protein